MPWDPTQIANVVAVWRADMGVTTSGSNVTAWADQTSNGYSLTGFNSPQYSATGFNSHPGITVSVSANSYLARTGMTFRTAPLSLWILFTVTGNNTNGGRLFSLGTGTGDDYTTPSCSFGVSMSGGNPTASGIDNIGSAGVTPSLNTPQLIGSITNGTNNNYYCLNSATAVNSQATSTPTEGSATSGNNVIGVGCQYNGYSGVQFDGTLAMVVLTSSAMSGTDIANLISFVNGVWGTSFAGGSSVTLTATNFLDSAPILTSPNVSFFSPLQLGNNVLDFGLRRFTSNANGLYICSTIPTTYVQATTTYTLGNISVAAGTLFALPVNGSPAGRIVNSTAINNGACTAAGTPVCWAVVDSINSDLMATGPMAGAAAVSSGQTWQLASFDVHYANS
jgi:hypothetical protein